VAAVIALIVAGLVYMVLNQQARPPQPVEVENVTVVVARQKIPAFETITSDMIEVREISRTAAPQGALTAPEQVIGQLAQVPIEEGQPIVRSQIAPRTAAQGLTFVIPDGMRAVTVALDPISGVGGFVYPGDRVDVLTTFKRGDITMTKTILQNVEVLAINNITSRPKPRTQQPTDQPSGGEGEAEAPAAEQVKSATLAVAPDQAQSLILCAYEGAIHLVLRPREDESVVSLAGQTDWELMGLKPPSEEKAPESEQATTAQMMGSMAWPPSFGPSAAPPAAEQPTPPPEEVPTVEVIRGTEREVVTPQ